MLDRPTPLRRSVRALLAGFGALAVFLPLLSSAESDDLDNLKNQADRWFDLELRIAAEKNQWKAEKEILVASREVLQKEQANLNANLAANELATSLFRTRFETAEAALGQHEAAHELLQAKSESIESRVRELLPRLPEPLRETIDPLLLKLESSSEEDPVSVAQRIQTLVAVLSTIDRFNNGLTLTHQLRPNAAGETLDIKVLYWGLAVAYAVDARGEGAWMLLPGPDGWEWRDQTANASEIGALLAVYEKQQSPRLVALPAAMTGGAP